MTDYDKLKLAHQLAEKYYNQSGDSIVIEHNCCFGCYVNVPCQFIINQTACKFDSLEDLIAKLKEITKTDEPKPKYKLAWFLMDGHINTTEVKNQEGFLSCNNTAPIAFGRTMYNSKKELIESQIEYWHKLKLEAMSPRFEGDIKSLNIYQSVITDGSTPTIGDSAIKAHENSLKLANQIKAGNKRINEILQENQECPLCGQLSPYLFPIPTKCQHESDNAIHNFSHPGEDGQLVMNKCKKCGEFYK